MPYIPEAARERAEYQPRTAGELNFAITSLLLDYIEDVRGKSYEAYNEVVGVLESVKLELYRRAVAPYEEEKAEVNGDVYR